MYDIILRLQRVIFNTDKKEKSVFNYKKNKMKLNGELKKRTPTA